jgi:hypothetical protein
MPKARTSSRCRNGIRTGAPIMAGNMSSSSREATTYLRSATATDSPANLTDAWASSMLAEDARIVMPPHPSWYSGREQVALFLRSIPLRADRRWKLVATSANGQPALAAYRWDDQAGAFTPHGISVLTVRGNQVEEIMAFLDPELLEPFALPIPLAV